MDKSFILTTKKNPLQSLWHSRWYRIRISVRQRKINFKNVIFSHSLCCEQRVLFSILVKFCLLFVDDNISLNSCALLSCMRKKVNRRKSKERGNDEDTETLRGNWIYLSYAIPQKIAQRSSPFKDNQTFPPRLIAFNFFHQRSNRWMKFSEKKPFYCVFFCLPLSKMLFLVIWRMEVK